MSKLLLSRNYSSNGSIMPKSIIQTTAHNYLFVGRYFPNLTDSNAFATMIDPTGNIIWNKIYSNAFTQFFTAVAQLNNGNFIAVGSYFYSDYSNDEYIWVAEIDSAGNIVSQNAYGKVGIQSGATSVAATSDGGYIVTGAVTDNDVLYTRIIKFDASSNIQWDKSIEGKVSFSIIETKDSGYLISGSVYEIESLNSHVFILRLNMSGDIIFEKIYTEFLLYNLLDSDAIETVSGNFVIAAKSLMLKTDVYGNTIWSNLDYSNDFVSVVVDANFDYTFAGSSIVNDTDHAYIAKVNKSTGTILSDNTELLYPSSISSIIRNTVGQLVVCSFVPFTNDLSQAIVAIF